MDEPTDLTSYLTEKDKALLKGYGWEPEAPKETPKVKPKLWHERRQDGTTTVTNYDPALRRQELELQLEIARRRSQEKNRLKKNRQRARAVFFEDVLLPLVMFFFFLAMVGGFVWLIVWASTSSPDAATQAQQAAQAQAQQAQQAQQDKICKAYTLAWNAPPSTDPAKLAQLAQIQSAYNQYCVH